MCVSLYTGFSLSTHPCNTMARAMTCRISLTMQPLFPLFRAHTGTMFGVLFIIHAPALQNVKHALVPQHTCIVSRGTEDRMKHHAMPCVSASPCSPCFRCFVRTGTMLGVLFIIIGLKLSLGTAGIIPSLNIPGGLISFAAIKSMAAVGSSLQMHTRAPLAHRLLFQPFGLQENAVMQTFVLSMGTGGFGSYITGE